MGSPAPVLQSVRPTLLQKTTFERHDTEHQGIHERILSSSSCSIQAHATTSAYHERACQRSSASCRPVYCTQGPGAHAEKRTHTNCTQDLHLASPACQWCCQGEWSGQVDGMKDEVVPRCCERSACKMATGGSDLMLTPHPYPVL